MEVEFVLNASMLEIYKETLFDLLSLQRVDLKIKESPTRGIYVEGLNSIVKIFIMFHLVISIDIKYSLITLPLTTLCPYSYY